MTWHNSVDCSFDREIHEQKAKIYKDLFKKYSQLYSNISVIDATNYFCDTKKCYATNEDGLLYTGDNNHLSMRGAMIINEALIKSNPRLFEDNLRD